MSNAPLDRRLVEDIVIFENKEAKKTGAQSIAPDHSPRKSYKTGPLPIRSAIAAGAEAYTLQHQIEQFLFHQSELLDSKHWQAFIDLFTSDGVYTHRPNRVPVVSATERDDAMTRFADMTPRPPRLEQHFGLELKSTAN